MLRTMTRAMQLALPLPAAEVAPRGLRRSVSTRGCSACGAPVVRAAGRDACIGCGRGVRSIPRRRARRWPIRRRAA